MLKMFKNIITQYSKYNVNMDTVINDVVNSISGR